MNLSQPQIEAILGQAPPPKPPADLKQRLLARIKPATKLVAAEASPLHSLRRVEADSRRLRSAGFMRGLFRGILPPRQSRAQSAAAARPAGGWLRRWGFLLAPATISLACAVVFTVQRTEINDLKANLRALSPSPGSAPPVPQSVAPTTTGIDASSGATPAPVQELGRLKQQAAQLRTEVSRLERMRAENEKLHAQLAVASTLPPQMQADLASMAKTKAKAQAIACVNNLKQLGLSVRLWAMDNGNLLPPDIRSMSNELVATKVLVCPADTNRQPAQSWATFSPANCSYQYLGGAGQPANFAQAPNRVLFLCPIDGSVTLADGSVQMGVAKTHPNWLVRSNGVLYLRRTPEPPSANPGGPASAPAGQPGSASASPRP